MPRKNIDFTTPEKKGPRRPWHWFSDSPFKRVTKDLFAVRNQDLYGIRRKTLNKEKSSLFCKRTLRADYSLLGRKKVLETPKLIRCNMDRLYTKKKQSKELKKAASYQGTSVADNAVWKRLGTLQYRDDAAMAKAKAKKAKATAIFHPQK